MRSSGGQSDGHRTRVPVARARRIDVVDEAIIEALQRDGRMPFRRISRALGVSESTVRGRYARLRDDDVLRVTGVANPSGLGFEARAMVGVRTSGRSEAVAEQLAQWPEAGYVVVTAGQFDVLVELVCADRHELLDVTGRLRSLNGVASTESFVYLELWKQPYDWGANLHDSPGTDSTVEASEVTE